MAAGASPPTSSTPRHTQPVSERKRRSRASRSWWARFTFNGITRCEQGSYLQVGGEELDQIVPSNHGGSDDLSNLQALCFRCNADKRVASCMFCALEGSGRVLVENELALDHPEWNAAVELLKLRRNSGEAAGQQTVFRAHWHLIPRHVGDCEEPRGGVRGVIAGKQKC